MPDINKLLKEVVAFCNHLGGKIVVGVRDDSTICGVNEQELEKQLEMLNKVIYECCSPPIIAKVYPRQMGAFTVLEIDISEGMMKPYFITSYVSPSCYEAAALEKCA